MTLTERDKIKLIYINGDTIKPDLTEKIYRGNSTEIVAKS